MHQPLHPALHLSTKQLFLASRLSSILPGGAQWIPVHPVNKKMDSRSPVFLLFFTNQNNLEYKGQGSKTLATISSLISGEGWAWRKKTPRRINSSKDPLVYHLAFCEGSLCPSNECYLFACGWVCACHGGGQRTTWCQSLPPIMFRHQGLLFTAVYSREAGLWGSGELPHLLSDHGNYGSSR